MSGKTIYKIIFHNNEKVFEIYATELVQSAMFGFVEISGVVFGEKSAIVIDPAEEKLKAEFGGVKRTYIPLHSVIRIDEVAQQGVAKIVDVKSTRDQVVNFPKNMFNKNDSTTNDK